MAMRAYVMHAGRVYQRHVYAHANDTEPRGTTHGTAAKNRNREKLTESLCDRDANPDSTMRIVCGAKGIRGWIGRDQGVLFEFDAPRTDWGIWLANRAKHLENVRCNLEEQTESSDRLRFCRRGRNLLAGGGASSSADKTRSARSRDNR